MSLSREECRAIGERTLRQVDADEALIQIREERERTTRFANNAVSFQAWVERVQVTAQISLGSRSGSATLEATDEDSLREVVRRATEAAREAPPDPEFLPVLGPQEYLPVEAWSADTANTTAGEQVARVRTIIESASRAGAVAAGTIETSESTLGLVSSRGLFAYHTRTDAEIGVTASIEDGSGWARRAAIDFRTLDAAALGAEAIETARLSMNPSPVPAGKYPVLLSPTAVADLLPALVYLADARQTEAGLTFLSGRSDDALAGEEITLRSDPRDARYPTIPFDPTGLSHQASIWIDRGRFVGRTRDRWTARKSGEPAVPIPASILLEGTTRSLSDLIEQMERGILVTRFWYIRPLKLEDTLFTGMTRDGTFRIEDGRIVGAVRQLRFNDTALGIIQRATALGTPHSCGRGGSCVMVPPILVREWEFVSMTEF